MKGTFYFSKIEITDDTHQIIGRIKDVPISTGMKWIYKIIKYKDSPKTLKKMFLDLFNYLDEDFKALWGVGKK